MYHCYRRPSNRMNVIPADRSACISSPTPYFKCGNRTLKSNRKKTKVLVVCTVAMESDSYPIKLSSSALPPESLGTFVSRKSGDRLLHGALSTGPYFVGLTGSIAAGKSFVRNLLKKKGAEVLDCDSLGHCSYIQGTPTYHAIVASFGSSVVCPDGSIDRRVLSSIVFSDPLQMDMLKRIVWNAVGQLVAEEKEAMAERGVNICFAEAALLFEAQWEKDMNEVWVVFAPREILRQRLILRNKISEEEADKRIDSQMSTAERIPLADVLIYNGWTTEETTNQIEKAWKLLLERVPKLSGREQRHPLWVRWAGLMSRLCVDEKTAIKWWVIIQYNYEKAGRDYHNLTYLQELFGHYHEHAHFISESRVVHLAIFFHDIERKSSPGMYENALASAATFEEFAAEAGLGPGNSEKVLAFLLHGTSDNYDGNQGGDLSFFLDFKLAVLGSSPELYQGYKTKMQREFKDKPFVTAHVQLLERFVHPKNFFHTDIFRSKLLLAAQSNLYEEMGLLVHR